MHHSNHLQTGSVLNDGFAHCVSGFLLQVSSWAVGPWYVWYLTDPKTVRLNDSRITAIQPGTFSQLKMCSMLNLSSNQLTEVKRDMFEGLNALRTLYVDHNIINDILPGAFSHPKLHEIYFNNNKLTNIRKAMWKGLHSLAIFHLDHNLITDIQPGTFSHLKKCWMLNLSHNKLTEVRQDMWDGLDALWHLHLDHNFIINIQQGAFSQLKRCEIIDISSNKLTTAGKDM